MDNTNRIKKIQTLLNDALEPHKLEVSDDSHLHSGHAGARSGKGHFTVEIRSSKFAGLGRLKQHQLVYASLGDMMQNDIHALVIKSDS